MSLLGRLESEKIIAILRHVPKDKLYQTVKSLHEGGINIWEVTLNSEDALESIDKLRSKYDQKGTVVGAGTVLDTQMAKEAIEAGAQFIISPNLNLQVIEYAVENQIDVWPGVMTPTEMVDAWIAGANAIKLFPAGFLGPQFIKDIKAPLENIPIIATGGINLDNQHQYFKAGAAAIGLGSQLVNNKMIENNQFEELKMLACRFVKEVNKESGSV